MIFEGREIKDNGCKDHDNCLTCPFEECKFVLGKDISEEEAKRKARQRAYYYKNKERILRNRMIREAKKKMSKFDGVTWIDNKSMTVIVDITERDKAIRREAFEEMLRELDNVKAMNSFKNWLEQKIHDIGA